MKWRIRVHKETIIQWFIITCCTYLSGHAYTLVAGWQYNVFVIILAFVGCALLRSRINVRPKIRDVRQRFILWMIIGTFMAYITNWHKNVWIDALILIARIILAYVITDRIDIKTFAKLYSSWITFLTVVALIVYLLLNLNIDIPALSYIGLNGLEYKTIWICSWTPSINNIRGPFWESGVYSSMVIYALIYECIVLENKPRIFNIIILSIGILVSQSTAGFILLLLMLYIIFTKGRKHHAIYDILTIIVISIVFIYAEQIIAMFNTFRGDLFWKIMDQSSVTTNTRIYSPIACLSIFLNNPITGNGISYATELYNLYKLVYRMDALTSTSTFMLAAFGVWGISYTVILISGALKQKQVNITTRLLLAALLIMIVNKEPHTSIIFSYILFFYLNNIKERGNN